MVGSQGRFDGVVARLASISINFRVVYARISSHLYFGGCPQSEVPLTNRRADTKEAELSFVHISGPQGSRQPLSGFPKFPVNDGEAYFIQRPSNRSLVTSRGVITRTGSLCGIPYMCNPDVSYDKPVESRRRSPV